MNLQQINERGESWGTLIRYWYPELITLFITTALPPLFDAYCVSWLSSLGDYSTLGIATNFVHMLIKFSEALPVAAIAIIGRYNGAKEYRSCGQEFITTIWTVALIGGVIAGSICFGASHVYEWLGLPAHLIERGIPFLQLRALSLFLAFLFFACTGFLRAIKNTYTPMLITLLGTGVYMGVSSATIFGWGPIPACGLYGPAWAAIAQQSVMLTVVIISLMREKTAAKYFASLSLFSLNLGHMGRILFLALPVMIDKTALSFAYVWLARSVAPLGEHAIATFDIIKNLERAAIMPAAAFAQVITFLVSNRIGARDPEGAYANTLKVLFLTTCIVGVSIGILVIGAPYFVTFFSPDESITLFAIPMLRTMSIFVIFDFVQLILAGALRGAGKVYTVMVGRFAGAILFFVPASIIVTAYAPESTYLTFGMIYGLFYINTAVMGGFFFWHLQRERALSKKT